MFRKGIWRVGILEIIGSAKTSLVTVLETDGNEMITRATGLATNRPSGAGYAVGCQYIASDSGAIYLNTGSTTSTTWTVLAGAAGSVTSADYATSSVLSTKIKDAAVTSGKIAAGAVVASKLAATAVTSGNITALNVNTAALAAGAATSAKIAAGAIVASKLATSSVTSSKLADSAVVAGKAKLVSVGVTVNKAATSGVVTNSVYTGATILGFYVSAATTSTKAFVGVASLSGSTVKVKMPGASTAGGTMTYQVVLIEAV